MEIQFFKANKFVKILPRREKDPLLGKYVPVPLLSYMVQYASHGSTNDVRSGLIKIRFSSRKYPKKRYRTRTAAIISE